MMWSHGNLVTVGLEGGVSLCIAMKNVQWTDVHRYQYSWGSGVKHCYSIALYPLKTNFAQQVGDILWFKFTSFSVSHSVAVNSFEHVDHLRGHEDHVLMFFAILNLTLICHPSGQQAVFVRSLTQDPSLIWNTLLTHTMELNHEPPTLSHKGCQRILRTNQTE